MSEATTQLDTLDELLSRLAEGGASDADRERLAGLLRGDMEAQRLYIAVMSVHGWLGWDGNAAASAEPTLVPASTAGRIGRYAAAVAAGLLFVAGVWLFAGSDASPTPDVDAPTGPVVAVLTEASSVSWLSEPIASGDELRSQSLRIASGRLVIDYHNGTSLTLVGPASFTIDSPLRSRLSLGKAVAQVTPRASGFTIGTPNGVRVVDRGTEFAVHVDAGGAAEVFVFDGTVDLVDREGRIAETMLAGDKRRIGRDGVLARAGIDGPASLEGPARPRTVALGHWDRDGDLGGWTTDKAVGVGVVDGVLSGRSAVRGDAIALDVKIIRDALRFNAHEYPFVELRYRTEGGVATFFWGNPSVRVGQSVALGEATGGWRTVLIDLRDDDRWAGEISVIRFDPVNNLTDAVFAIDHIRLHADDPTDGSLEPITTHKHGARVYRLDPPEPREPPAEKDGPVESPLQESSR